MKLELETSAWAEAAFYGAAAHPMGQDRWETNLAWEKIVTRAVIWEMLNPEYLRYHTMLEDTNVFHMLDAPYTILDPAGLPEEPDGEDGPGEGATEEAWRAYFAPWHHYVATVCGEAGPDVKMYQPDFNPDNKPFTVAGWWSDEGGASGYFGFVQGETTLVVLFC